MALQGTLDTFALADLIRLLATTTKTGELAIDGDRGTGCLWFVDGDLVGGRPAPEGGAEDALFELLRFADGEFHFVADQGPADGGHDAVSALEVLEAAERRIEEWGPIAALVPSERVGVRLAEAIDREVTVSPEIWSQLLLVAPGTTAGAFAAALDLDEVRGATAVRDLHELGLVSVGPEVEPEVDDEPTPAAEAEGERDADDQAAGDVEVEIDDEGPAADSGLDDGGDGAEGWEATGWSAEPERAESGDDELHPVDADALAPVAEVPAPAPTLGERLLGAEERPMPALDAAGWVDWGQPEVEPVDALTTATMAALDEVLPVDEEPGHDPLAALDLLPRIEAPSAPAEQGDLAVDLDSHLDAGVSDHRYLATEDVSSALPEPLLTAEPADDEVDAPMLDAAPVDDAVAAPAPVDWNVPDTREQELAMQLDALSPAAARAVAAAASEGRDGTEDSEAGRRVLRRIISSGRS